MFHRHIKLMTIMSLLLFVVCAGALVWFLHLIEIRKGALEVKAVEQADILSSKKSLETFTSALSDTEKERKYIATRILSDEDVVDFLALIEKIGKEYGVTLETSALTVRPLNDSFESLAVTVEVKGTYVALMHTLTMFESLPYQVSIHDVHFERSDEKGQLWKSTYTILATKYVAVKKP